MKERRFTSSESPVGHPFLFHSLEVVGRRDEPDKLSHEGGVVGPMNNLVPVWNKNQKLIWYFLVSLIKFLGGFVDGTGVPL